MTTHLLFLFTGIIVSSLYWRRKVKLLEKRNGLLRVIADYEIKRQDALLDFFPQWEDEEELIYSSLN